MEQNLAAGIISAGAGSRLRQGDAAALKPLVPVRGKPLAGWVTEGLRSAGARRIAILLNSSGGPVRDHLQKTYPDLAWTFLQQDTASSWESFRLVARRLADENERFLISTVDALIRPADVARFAREAFAPGYVAALALTRFVDDEKPLWAELGEDGTVAALGDDVRRRDAVTCGLYALTREAVRAMPPAAEYGKLRDFWKTLAGAAPVRGVLLGDTVDVDRPQDMRAAEEVTLCFDA